MKLALLKGNRFNPWHMQVFDQIPEIEVTAFRAESEVQRTFRERDDRTSNIRYEDIFYRSRAGPVWSRWRHLIGERYFGEESRIVPFHGRLRGFDLVQSWELFTDWTAQAVAAKRDFGTPLALMVWDNIPFNHEDSAERKAMKRRALESADRFIVHSERSRRSLLIEGADPNKIVFMDHGVDTTKFAPGTGHRPRLGLDNDEFVILFVGWLLPRKGIEFLILALRELVSDATLADRRIRLVAVGTGQDEPRIRSLVAQLKLTDRCTFLGSKKYGEMPAIYRSADAFVLPSVATRGWQEQFGMALMEAMASGLPIVAARSGAIPEIAGDAAALVQPSDFLSLYETIRDLVKDDKKRKSLGDAARARALGRFTLDRYAEALGRVYGELLRGE